MNIARVKIDARHPRVSIVMTVYNHEELVGEAIQSVLAQSFKDYEFIIINDGSTDNTDQVLARYQDQERIIIKNIEHVGRARALNIAFNITIGEYISIIDSDDIYLPAKLERQVDYLDRHPRVAMVGTNSIEHDLVNNKKYLNFSPNKDDDIKKLLLYDTAYPFPAVMTRKRILKEVGFCDEQMKSKIDFDLFGRIATKGKVANIPEILVIIRRHPKRHFRYGLDAEHHRKTRLKVRWLNLWRLKPPFFLFIRTLTWLCFEYSVHLFPVNLRHSFPKSLRDFFKTHLLPDVKLES
jgi:glycosyltransferase involved in cell wall biosynthesis